MSGQWSGGKGDKRRRGDTARFDAGYDMIHGKTEEIRETARRRWEELRPKPKNQLDIVDSDGTLEEDDTPSFYFQRPQETPDASD